MSKIIAAQDALGEARACIQCLFMATNELRHEEAEPLQAVADIASMKIKEAITLLQEYRTDIGDGPVEFPATPSATPASKATRTKRKGQ
jgi:hypothetical protein